MEDYDFKVFKILIEGMFLVPERCDYFIFSCLDLQKKTFKNIQDMTMWLINQILMGSSLNPKIDDQDFYIQNGYLYIFNSTYLRFHYTQLDENESLLLHHITHNRNRYFDKVSVTDNMPFYSKFKYRNQLDKIIPRSSILARYCCVVMKILYSKSKINISESVLLARNQLYIAFIKIMSFVQSLETPDKIEKYNILKTYFEQSIKILTSDLTLIINDWNISKYLPTNLKFHSDLTKDKIFVT